MTQKNSDHSALIARSKAGRTADIDLAASTELSTQVAALSMSPLDMPQEQFKDALERRTSNRHLLLQWISTNLREGIDYGKITMKSGKVSKASLLKPGAEKLCNIVGVFANFSIKKEQEAGHIIVECYLRDAKENTIAHGIGGRTLRQDNGDINKSIKMSMKSSMISAVLSLCAISEIFTQDLEDMVAPKEVTPETDSGDLLISTLQVQRLHQKIRTLNLSLLRVNQWLTKAWSVDSIEQLPRDRFDTLMGKLDQWAEDLKAQQQRRA